MHIEPHNMSSIPITNMAANYLVKDIWSNSFVIVLDGNYLVSISAHG